MPGLLEMIERKVDGVAERRLSIRAQTQNRVLQPVLIGYEVGAKLDLLIEGDNKRFILFRPFIHDVNGGPVNIADHFHHAAAAIQNDPPADRRLFGAEETERLFDAVFIQLEILALQSRYRSPFLIRHRHAQGDQISG